jgi:hypothetical protein
VSFLFEKKRIHPCCHIRDGPENLLPRGHCVPGMRRREAEKGSLLQMGLESHSSHLKRAQDNTDEKKKNNSKYKWLHARFYYSL